MIEPARQVSIGEAAAPTATAMVKTDVVPLGPSTVVTRRLTLSPLVEDDAETMVTVLQDERMHEFTGGRPLTLGELRARYRQLVVGHSRDRAQLWFNWIIRVTATAEAVGVMQATVAFDASSAEIAWEVGVPWQGRGFASEAATAVVGWLIDQDVPLICAHVHPDHAASAKVAARAGLAPTAEVVDDEVVWRRLTR